MTNQKIYVGEFSDTYRLREHYKHGLCIAKCFHDYKHYEKEATILALVGKLPRIVEVLECASPTIYFRFYSGGTLEEKLTSTHVSPIQTEKWQNEANLIINSLHAIGISHGDFKAKNMMIDDHDQGLVLIDFGSATMGASCDDFLADLQKQAYLHYQLAHECTYVYATFSIYLEELLRHNDIRIQFICNSYLKDKNSKRMLIDLHRSMLAQGRHKANDGCFGHLIKFLIQEHNSDIDQMDNWLAAQR